MKNFRSAKDAGAEIPAPQPKGWALYTLFFDRVSWTAWALFFAFFAIVFSLNKESRAPDPDWSVPSKQALMVVEGEFIGKPKGLRR